MSSGGIDFTSDEEPTLKPIFITVTTVIPISSDVEWLIGGPITDIDTLLDIENSPTIQEEDVNIALATSVTATTSNGAASEIRFLNGNKVFVKESRQQIRDLTKLAL